MAASVSSQRVLWLQVWGLAAVQGAIALMWVIYNLYLVDLLTQVGLPKSLAVGLLIIENLLAVVMEPLMGTFSDRAQQWVGSRFPMIAIGVALAATCFILTPIAVVFGWDSGAARWVLPIILVAWALAMTVFRSPALSLLGRYAFATQLPQAASILTLVGGVAGAMGPLAGEFILGLGSVVAFALGSLVLLIAAGALRLFDPDRTVQPLMTAANTAANTAGGDRAIAHPPISIPALGLIFGAGVGVGLGFRLLMLSFPQLIQAQAASNPSLIVGLIFIALAVTAIPAGILTTRLGNRLGMMIGLAAMAVFCGLMVLMQGLLTAAGLAIALGAAFSLVSNSTIPFALAMVPPDKAGLGTGIYFSGGALASSLFGMLMTQLGSIPTTIGGVGSAIAFLAAAVCVALSVQPEFDHSKLEDY